MGKKTSEGQISFDWLAIIVEKNNCEMSNYIMFDFFKYVLMDNKTNLANFLFENWFNLLEIIYLTNMVFVPWPVKGENI